MQIVNQGLARILTSSFVWSNSPHTVTAALRRRMLRGRGALPPTDTNLEVDQRRDTIAMIVATLATITRRRDTIAEEAWTGS